MQRLRWPPSRAAAISTALALGFLLGADGVLAQDAPTASATGAVTDKVLPEAENTSQDVESDSGEMITDETADDESETDDAAENAAPANAEASADNAGEPTPDPMDLPYPGEETADGKTDLYGPDAGVAAAEPEITVPDGATPLQLDVNIDGKSTKLIAAFFLFEDGRIASTRSELQELGLAAPGQGVPGDIVMLDDVPTVTYRYDEAMQAIDISVGPEGRVMQAINASRREKDIEAEEAAGSTGVLLNYSLFTQLGSTDYQDLTYSGLATSLEGRVFSPWGDFTNSANIGFPEFEQVVATRLDTYWTHADPKRMLEYQLGDMISGSLNWTRPVRLGGGSVRRNFGLRPDLITMPLPTIDGSAGVPSTLDLYLNGVKSYSQRLDEGPFKIDDVPVFTNDAKARVVLTDINGREVTAEGEFFTSPDLLRPGLFDFSLQAGYLRENYGDESFDYSDYPVAIASMRFGLTDLLTAEAHAEGSEDLQNVGIGALAAIPRFGVVNAAISASLYDADTGIRLYGSWEKSWGDFFMNASVARTLGRYEDLASVNALELSKGKSGGTLKALEQVSAGYYLREQEIGIGASLVHSESRKGSHEYVVSGSASKRFDYFDINGTGYYRFGKEVDYGLGIGLAMPLGKTMSGSTGATVTKKSHELYADVSKPHTDDTYSTAWQVSAKENGSQALEGRSETRTPVGDLNANAFLSEKNAIGNLAFDGAVVATRKGITTGRYVSDSFAIVDAGAPGVSVRHENRYAGKTGRNGQLLITNLAPYANNKFNVELDDLPVTAEMPVSEKFIVPRSRSGVIVDFAVKASSKAAIVKIQDSSGKPIPVSTEILLAGNTEPFLMGYDGEVYLTDIADKNDLTVKLPAGDCTVSFDYTGSIESQEFVGPLTCA